MISALLVHGAVQAPSVSGSPWWLILVTPAAALLGVALSQVITLANERGKRLSAHVSEARDSAELLMGGVYSFAMEVVASKSVQKHDENDVYEDLWADAVGELTKKAALLTGRQGHREVVEGLFAGLNHAHGLAGEGLGVGENVRRDYHLMSYAAFDAVAAWVRREAVPRSSRRVARKVKRSLYWYGLEWRARDYKERTGKELKSGILRRAWRWSLKHSRRLLREVVRPVCWLWNFLFRP
jgi:hypothetical protein